MGQKTKTYSELIALPTFEERLAYLKLDCIVGRETFGHDRYLNQDFYSSNTWKDIRRAVIVRDYGCDLACEGWEIHGRILVHHMNPVTPDDIIHSTDILLEPEYLITTCKDTHNLIHYGVENPMPKLVTERRPGDTKLW